jgi:phosphoglycerate dehydrogenase-like enzyme
MSGKRLRPVVSDDELEALLALADVVNSMMYAAPETRSMWDEELVEAHAAWQATRR